jgi:hypothetical protein
MIWVICFVFVFFWIVGLVAQIGGVYIHALLAVAVILALLNFAMGKSKRVRA